MHQARRQEIQRWAWGMAFVAALMLPLFVAARSTDGQDLIEQLSLTSGLMAGSVLIVTIVLPSRIRSLITAFGIERILGSHRWMGSLTLSLVLVHLALVLVAEPDNVHLLDAINAPNRARAAVGATVGLILLCLTPLLRKHVRLGYASWRWLHVVLGVSVLVLSGLHVYWLHHLVRDPWVKTLFVVMAVFVVGVLANRWLLRPVRDHRRGFVVDLVRPESETVTTLRLRPQDPRSPGLRFQPGQFAWLRLDHSFSLSEEHPFSIASGAHRPHDLEFTVRHAGDFTSGLAGLRPGRRAYVDGPYGSFIDRPARGKDLLLIAGGVGITPMISILRTLAHRQDPRRHRLLISSRNHDELLFREELVELTHALDLSVTELVSQPSPGWTGRTGRVDHAVLSSELRETGDRRHIEAYICGPAPMVDAVHESLLRLGIPDRQVHTEQFTML